LVVFFCAVIPWRLTLNLSKLRTAILHNGEMELNYEYFENTNKKKIIQISNLNQNIKSLYKNKLSISEKKFLDLKNLCNVNSIPTKYHSEYVNLKNCKTIVDCLDETDEEDEN